MSDELETTLNKRGSTYGDFRDNSNISQELKKVIRCGLGFHSLSNMHVEALDMICHKISRIVTANPDYKDSWIDIAGYAQLVADRVPSENGGLGAGIDTLNKCLKITTDLGLNEDPVAKQKRLNATLLQLQGKI